MSCTDEPPGTKDLLHLLGRRDRGWHGEPEDYVVRQVAHRLTMWAKVSDDGIVPCAVWVKKKLARPRSGETVEMRVRLLQAFGMAFRGDEVGVLGQDILQTALNARRHLDLRHAALDCLDRWLAYDEDGRWRDILDRLCEREDPSQSVRDRIHAMATEWGGCEDEEGFGASGDCPACGLGDVMRVDDDTWACGYCGDAWGEDPREALTEAETQVAEETDERPPAWRRLLEGRGSVSRARALLERRHVPAFLERTLDVHPHLALGVLESLDVGHLCCRENDLEFLELDRLSSPGRRLLAVLRGAKRGFSIEPTATEDRYLVFTYF